MNIHKITRIVFDNPAFYSCLMSILGSGEAMTRLVNDFIRPAPGDRIFDFGCGPADIINYLPTGIEYVGFDFNEKCIDSAKMKYGNRGTFILGNIADDSIPNCGQFDIVCAIGVLHHLPEKDAVKLIDDGVKLLKEGGRLITLDNINEDYVGVVNKIALKLDRGAYIRNKDDYLKLFSKYHDIRFTIKKAPMRIPYYHIICELIKRP